MFTANTESKDGTLIEVEHVPQCYTTYRFGINGKAVEHTVKFNSATGENYPNLLLQEFLIGLPNEVLADVFMLLSCITEEKIKSCK